MRSDEMKTLHAPNITLNFYLEKSFLHLFGANQNHKVQSMP